MIGGLTEPVEAAVSEDDGRVFLPELSSMLDKKVHTIRRWISEARFAAELAGGAVPEDKGFLPEYLWPHTETDGRRRMYWLPEQVVGMREFAESKARRRGWQAMRSA